MRDCARCRDKGIIKDGFVKGVQRYQCKRCQYRFTVRQRSSRFATNEIKRQALQLYLEGLGFRSIARVLKFSHVAVYKWIRCYGESIKTLADTKANNNINIVEIDEMHSYIGSKKTIAGYGLLLIDIKTNLSMLSLGVEELKQVKNYGVQ